MLDFLCPSVLYILAIYEPLRSLGMGCVPRILLACDRKAHFSNPIPLPYQSVSFHCPNWESHLREHLNDKMTLPTTQSHNAHLFTKRIYKRRLVDLSMVIPLTVWDLIIISVWGTGHACLWWSCLLSMFNDLKPLHSHNPSWLNEYRPNACKCK